MSASLPQEWPNRADESALKSKEFTIFWLGHSLSSVGTKMQQVALLWHIYELTNSTKALGMMGLVKLVPVLALVLFGGLIADLIPRRRVLLYSQSVMGLLSTGLGLCCLLGEVSPFMLYAVAALSEAASAFDGPSRKALIPQLVSPSAISSALTLTSITKNASKLAGPALMGLTVAFAPIGWVYLINGFSFAAVIFSLTKLEDIEVVPDEGPETNALQRLNAGFQFLKRSKALLSVLALDFGANLWAAATVLLPVYAREVLSLGSKGYGLLVSAIALGGLLGSAFLLFLPDPPRKGRWVVMCSVGYGLGAVLLGVSSSIYVSLFALIMIGLMDQISSVLRNTIHQLITPDEMRGRVTAINMIFSKSGPRLGELEAGLAASWLGLTSSIFFGGVACVFTTALVALWYKPIWHRVD